MNKIVDDRVFEINGKWFATCINCNKQCSFIEKSSALKMIYNKSCRYCKKDYRNINIDIPIYKNLDNKWCKKCSGCDVEQVYTRKDH